MKERIERLEKTEIGYHHVAVENTKLEYALINAYQEGFYDSKQMTINTINTHIKDETLKSLLLAALDLNKSKYSYLEG